MVSFCDNSHPPYSSKAVQLMFILLKALVTIYGKENHCVRDTSQQEFIEVIWNAITAVSGGVILWLSLPSYKQYSWTLPLLTRPLSLSLVGDALIRLCSATVIIIGLAGRDNPKTSPLKPTADWDWSLGYWVACVWLVKRSVYHRLKYDWRFVPT